MSWSEDGLGVRRWRLPREHRETSWKLFVLSIHSIVQNLSFSVRILLGQRPGNWDQDLFMFTYKSVEVDSIGRLNDTWICQNLWSWRSLKNPGYQTRMRGHRKWFYNTNVQNVRHDLHWSTGTYVAAYVWRYAWVRFRISFENLLFMTSSIYLSFSLLVTIFEVCCSHDKQDNSKTPSKVSHGDGVVHSDDKMGSNLRFMSISQPSRSDDNFESSSFFRFSSRSPHLVVYSLASRFIYT